MGDLISREALLRAYDDAHNGEPGATRGLIMAAPAVDAIEVVHCADCVHYQKFNELGDFYCGRTDSDYYSPHYDAATYYCAEGARRGDDGCAGD